MNGHAASVNSVEIDPLRKSGGPKCCDAQRGISSSGVVGCTPRTEGAHMRRRDFITLLGGLAVWPLAAHDQRTTRPIVGFLNSASADKYAYLAAAFRQGQYDRLSEMAADLVRREPAVIAANTPAVMPVKKATSTIPIVFFTAADPVA